MHRSVSRFPKGSGRCRSRLVELQHPVPYTLQTDLTTERGFASATAVINYCQRQKPANLNSIAPRLRKPPQCRLCNVRPQPNRRRHHSLPRKGMLDHINTRLEIARVKQASRLLVSVNFPTSHARAITVSLTDSPIAFQLTDMVHCECECGV